MDECRWIFGEKEKDFLVATPRNFSNNKRINPKRFRHLDGRSRLHQGFLCFSYKQRASQRNSSPPSTREKYHFIRPMLQLHHHPKFSASILQYLGFSRLQGGEGGDVTITIKSSTNVPSSSPPQVQSLDYSLEDSRVGFEFFMLSIWCSQPYSLITLFEFLFVA